MSRPLTIGCEPGQNAKSVNRNFFLVNTRLMSGFTRTVIGMPHVTRKKFRIRFLLFVLYLHYFDDYEPSYFKFFRTGENFKFKNETNSNWKFQCYFKTDIDVMKCLDIKKSTEQIKCTIVWNRPSLPEVVPL